MPRARTQPGSAACAATLIVVKERVHAAPPTKSPAATTHSFATRPSMSSTRTTIPVLTSRVWSGLSTASMRGRRTAATAAPTPKHPSRRP